jgi:hypothetical protein
MRYMNGYTRIADVGKFTIFKVANSDGVYYTIEEEGCVVAYFQKIVLAYRYAFENL